ncbi:YitT family protein [Mycoplasmopsis lipofaciens]|uniref:YitT family protein n=1 Tax=Mycoplasmopsis lipofaciens TaxID=114884 RepID=UPI0004838758|nr:YitT family protein [Mycoplasmopsis lipofaciens]
MKHQKNEIKKSEVICESITCEKRKIEIKKLEMGKYSYDHENRKEKEVKKRRIILYLKRTFFILLSAIIFNFGAIAFLQKGETIPSGISGIPMLITLLDPEKFSKYFALLYLVCNVPLFAIYGWRIKRGFVFLTFMFMFFQIVTNAIFTQEVVLNWIHHFFNVVPGWERTLKVSITDSITGITTFKEFENPSSWPIFINGVIGSVLLGVSIALAWKFGGSTGGTDIIAYYYSTKKQKSISRMLMVVSFTTTFIFLIIFAFAVPHKPTLNEILQSKMTYDSNGNLLYSMDYTQDLGQRNIIGMREFSTIIYIFIVNGLIAIIYPKYKKVTMSISTKDPELVLDYLKEIKYWHAYSINKATSGYTGQDVYKIESTMLLLETRSITRDLKHLDENVWIEIKPVYNIYGRFATKYVDEN